MSLVRICVLFCGARGALLAQAAIDEAALRKELARMYASLDAAFEQGRPGDALRIALPDAAVRYGMEETRFSTVVGRAKQMLDAGVRVKQNTVIMSLSVDESRVRVRRRTESSVLAGGQARSGVDHAEDIWVQVSEGWRLKLSNALGAVERVPPTSAETAALVVKEIDGLAKPVTDSEAVSAAIGDARIVALGEATHGTREFSSTKARLVEHLAASKGFTALAVEDGWAEALAVDAFLETGRGSAEEALARLRNWPNKTPEMLGLIRALRSINSRSPGKVSFAGFDMTTSNRARELATEFVRRTLPNQVEEGGELSADAARKILDLFDAHRGAMEKASDHRQWRRARQAALIVHQAAVFRGETRAVGYRDEMMARNVEWLGEEEHPGEKIWAHNGHVSTASGTSYKPMGTWLRERYGRRYRALGFAIGGGEVRAWGEGSGGLRHAAGSERKWRRCSCGGLAR